MITLRFRSRAMALAASMLAAAPLALSPMVATPAHAIIEYGLVLGIIHKGLAHLD